MSGFIDPDDRNDARLDRLEVLIDEALKHVGIEALSPEAQAIHADLLSNDRARVARARATLHAQMAADPLPEAMDEASLPFLPDPSDKTGGRGGPRTAAPGGPMNATPEAERWNGTSDHGYDR